MNTKRFFYCVQNDRVTESPNCHQNACSTNQITRKMLEHYSRLNSINETTTWKNSKKFAKETDSIKETFKEKTLNWCRTAVLYVKTFDKTSKSVSIIEIGFNFLDCAPSKLFAANINNSLPAVGRFGCLVHLGGVFSLPDNTSFLGRISVSLLWSSSATDKNIPLHWRRSFVLGLLWYEASEARFITVVFVYQSS